MIEQLKTLAQMQLLDDQIGRLRILQQELPKQLGEIIDSVDQATANLLACETARAEIEKKQRTLELEIKTYQEQIKKYGAQLSEIKNNKEYKALNSEIVYLKEKIEAAESSLLELMDSDAEAKEQVNAAKAELQQAEQRKKDKEGDLRHQIDSLESEIEAVRNKRNDLARTLPIPVVKHYGNLIKHKDNQAVAFNREGSCGACGFVIRQQMRIELQLKRKLVYCENCGRILMNRINEAEEEAPAEPEN